MADPPPYPGTPCWVKVSGIIVTVVLVLLLGIRMLVPGAGGGHGRGAHAPSGAGDDTLTISVVQDQTAFGSDGGGHNPPEWSV